MSREEIQDFCRKLGELTGENVQLPTETQWEYACRAGTTTALYTGDIEIIGENNAPALDPISWYGGNSGKHYSGGEVDGGFDPSDWEETWEERQYNSNPSGVHEVKGKEPNAWGLYDMIGNVMEWCSGWKGDYPSELAADSRGADSGQIWIRRGGAWSRSARYCRSANRTEYCGGSRFFDVGFRPAVVSAE